MARIEFDTVVVGAGPAGLTASLLLARAGLRVALIERGEFPGAKNVMGGQIYSFPTREILPGFWKEAPVERAVTEKKLWLLAGDARIELSFRDARLGEAPYNAFTVLRARFDRWFAKKAQEAGALIIPETLVTGLIREGGKVAGVRTGRDRGEIFAPVVIAADGVNSILSRDAGLHPELKPSHAALAVKEIIELPAGAIEDFFGLEKDQGVTIEIVGDFLKGMVGTGFIYTNKNTLSVGVGCLASDFVEKGASPYDLIEEMKAHPAVRPLLAKGQLREYLAHLIPEGGYDALPPLHADGLLVAGDAGMLVNGLHQEGSNLAMMSGKLAAETVLEARKSGDYSARSLSLYKKKLDESFVLQDLKKYRRAMPFLEKNRHLFTLYPQLLAGAAREMVGVDGTPKRTKQGRVVRRSVAARGLAGLIKDAFGAWRTFR